MKVAVKSSYTHLPISHKVAGESCYNIWTNDKGKYNT
jgi:hypothetical protein